jgi:hypothetical protein
MMRDRDLADITVSGEGVWDRVSDGDWEEKRDREEVLLRSKGAGSIASDGFTTLDHGVESEEDSMPSTGHSVETEEGRRKSAAREERRARRKEADYRIMREVGWKCFRWEEREGLPSGFRGGKGGPLSEEGIRSVMTKVGLFHT